MLVEMLKHIQARDNLTDQQFAERIGIRRGSWNRIKNYRVSFGKNFLSLLRQTYPELKDAIDIFLSTGITTDTRELPTVINHNAPQTTQESKLERFKTWLGGLVLRAKKLWRNSREA